MEAYSRMANRDLFISTSHEFSGNGKSDLKAICSMPRTTLLSLPRGCYSVKVTGTDTSTLVSIVITRTQRVTANWDWSGTNKACLVRCVGRPWAQWLQVTRVKLTEGFFWPLQANRRDFLNDGPACSNINYHLTRRAFCYRPWQGNVLGLHIWLLQCL